MTYELQSIRLPRLTGALLRAFAKAVELPLIRGLLLANLFQTAGLPKLRKTHFTEPITPWPMYYADPSAAGAPQPIDLSAIGTARGGDIPAIADYTRAYREGTATPLDVAERFLEGWKRSDQDDPPLKAFIAVDRENLMAQAEAASRRWKEGRPLSVLDGVPVAIKDELDMTPFPTTVGTAFLGKAPAARDATVVARLRALGALLAGKANMHEIGIYPNSLNVHHGTARNPYHPDHDSGGSSSGPATAVASGLCPTSIGADGGGSIRIPAALCGLVGLKCTFGRVSEAGAAPLCWSVAHVGPLSATAEDAALTYAAIAGPDPLDPNTRHQPPVTLAGWDREDLRGVTLGVYPAWFDHGAKDVTAACREAVDRLKDRGARVVEVEIPWLEETRIAHVITILAEMAASLDQYPEHRASLGAATRLNLAIGRAFKAEDYVQAQRMRTRAMATFQKAFETVDAVLTPATAVTAPVIPAGGLAWGWSDLGAATEVMRFAFAGNLTGLPAITFPVGYNEKGLPIGLQAMGRPYDEALLLGLARISTQDRPPRVPKRFYRLLR